MKEPISENVNLLIDDASRYIEAKAELWKLKAADKSSEAAASLLSCLLLFAIAMIVLFTINTGIAFLIGKWLGEIYYGFFIVAGFYLLLGIVLFASREKLIKRPFYNMLINKMLK